MKKVQFYESEYPYDTLEKFGLTREMIEDLPMHVLDDLSAGLRSPVLPIKVNNDNGDEIAFLCAFWYDRIPCECTAAGWWGGMRKI